MRKHTIAAAILALAAAACGGTTADTTTPTTFEERLTALATRAGVADVAAWTSCRTDPAVNARVTADVTLGGTLGVSGTPTFFVNGTKIVGSQPASVFRSVIDAALATARASGIPAAQYYDTVAPQIPVADSPVNGPADAWVTIVAFSDFQCPYCGSAQATLASMLPSYGASVRYVFKDFPLSFHAYARPTAIAAACAGAQGRFWQFHDLVFADQGALFGGP